MNGVTPPPAGEQQDWFSVALSAHSRCKHNVELTDLPVNTCSLTSLINEFIPAAPPQ